MQVKKQQLELDMEQQTGSKPGKEYVKAVYCHPPACNAEATGDVDWIPGWEDLLDKGTATHSSFLAWRIP